MAKMKLDEADQKLYSAVREWTTAQNKSNAETLVVFLTKILKFALGLGKGKLSDVDAWLAPSVKEWVAAKQSKKKGISFITLLTLLLQIFEAVFDDFNTPTIAKS